MNESGENKAENPGEATRNSGINVRVFGRTDVGLVREHNEDNFLIADLTGANRSILPEVRNHEVGVRGSLFAVCDGMGGAAAGEVASRIGVDTIYEMMQDGDPPIDDFTLARRLDLAICEAGTRIFTAAKLNRGQRGMGTTSTVATLIGPRLVLGQVGDSRAHIIRRGRLVQVTKDQSLVQQLIDAKQLTEEEARDFDRSNIILQALGTTEEVHVDITCVELRRGDALVMCSDGLSGMVEPEVIRDTVLQIDDPMDACRRLTELACDGGGDDNITVIVARFDGEGLVEATDGDVIEYTKFEYPKTTETTVRAPISRFTKSDAPPGSPEGGSATSDAPQSTSGIEEPSTKAATASTEGGAEGPGVEPTWEESKRAKETKEPVAKPEGGRRDRTAEDGARARTDEDRPSPEKKKSGAGVAIGVVAALAVVGGIGGYAVFGGSSGQEAALGQPAAIPAVSSSPVAPVSAISPPTENPGAAVGPSPAPGGEEPRLDPIDIDHITGQGDESPRATAPGGPQTAKNGADGGAKAKEAAKEKAPVATGAQSGAADEAVKKKPKPKKKSIIDENPYE